MADSPLRDRVVFIEGAPRSGTTLLATLVSSHPEIAGTGGESHLFDQGLGCLFDNLEGPRPYLVSFVSREALVDLARELSDGVLGRMRAQTRPDARFVVEKTPARPGRPEVPLARKREVYPDAWYLHIVRDGDAVARSMRKTFRRRRSAAEARRWWRESVEAIRATFGEGERYREISFEKLTGDPAGVMAGLFSWLGLESDDRLRERIAALAKERFSPRGPDDPGRPILAAGGGEGDGGAAAAAAEAGPSAGAVRHLLGRVRRSVRPAAPFRGRVEAPEGDSEIGHDFAAALRDRDRAELERLTAPELELYLRSEEGDLLAAGDEARAGLVEAGGAMFKRRLLSESWTVSPGEKFTTVMFSGVHHDGARVDVCFALLIRAGRIPRVSVLSAGSLSGRPLREWTLAPRVEGEPAR